MKHELPNLQSHCYLASKFREVDIPTVLYGSSTACHPCKKLCSTHDKLAEMLIWWFGHIGPNALCRLKLMDTLEKFLSSLWALYNEDWLVRMHIVRDKISHPPQQYQKNSKLSLHKWSCCFSHEEFESLELEDCKLLATAAEHQCCSFSLC